MTHCHNWGLMANTRKIETGCYCPRSCFFMDRDRVQAP